MAAVVLLALAAIGWWRALASVSAPLVTTRLSLVFSGPGSASVQRQPGVCAVPRRPAARLRRRAGGLDRAKRASARHRSGAFGRRHGQRGRPLLFAGRPLDRIFRRWQVEEGRRRGWRADRALRRPDAARRHLARRRLDRLQPRVHVGTRAHRGPGRKDRDSDAPRRWTKRENAPMARGVARRRGHSVRDRVYEQYRELRRRHDRRPESRQPQGAPRLRGRKHAPVRAPGPPRVPPRQLRPRGRVRPPPRRRDGRGRSGDPGDRGRSVGRGRLFLDGAGRNARLRAGDLAAATHARHRESQGGGGRRASVPPSLSRPALLARWQEPGVLGRFG